MQEETKKIIKERFEQLPQQIKDAILSASLPQQISTITEKNLLHVDQSGELEIEIMLVMLGLENVNDFEANLEKALEVNREKAIRIARDVNDTIILPILDSLKKIYELEMEKDSKEEKGGQEAFPQGNSWKKITPHIEQPQKIQTPVNPPKPESNTIQAKPAPFPQPNKNVEMRQTDYIVKKDVYSQNSWKRIDPATLEHLEKKATPLINEVQKQPEKAESKREDVSNPHLAGVREILSHSRILRAIEEPDSIPHLYTEAIEEPSLKSESAKEMGDVGNETTPDEPMLGGVPEIAPPHELMIEEGEVAHDVTPQNKEVLAEPLSAPIPASIQTASTPSTPQPSTPPVPPSKPVLASVPNYTPDLSSAPKAPIKSFFPDTSASTPEFQIIRPRIVAEPIQNPSTPEFKTSSTSSPETKVTSAVAPSPQPAQKSSFGGGFIDSMLHGIVSLPKEEQTKDDRGQKPTENYKVDPYRERI